MSFEVDTSELRALSADLASASGRVGSLASKALRKTAFDIEGTSKGLAAVDTGAMKNSISTTITGDGRFGEMAAEIGPTVDYAPHLEYGTSRMAPQPFMGPAFDRHAPLLEQALGQIGEDLF